LDVGHPCFHDGRRLRSELGCSDHNTRCFWTCFWLIRVANSTN
jgi:hypothetical protein